MCPLVKIKLSQLKNVAKVPARSKNVVQLKKAKLSMTITKKTEAILLENIRMASLMHPLIPSSRRK